MPLINCEVSLILTWFREYVITTMKRIIITNTRRDTSLTNAIFQITDTKLYVPVLTLSIENDKRFLEQLGTGFKRTIKRNKYRSEMTNQTKNNNLNYVIDPQFTKFNRLFLLSFENEKDRTYFSKYYVPNVQIEDFNLLIHGKSFFDMPIKNDEETQKTIEMGRINDYTIGNLLDYEYFSKHYKLIAIGLGKQMNQTNKSRKKINLSNKLISLEHLKEMKEQQRFSSLKSQKKQLLNFPKMLQQLFDFDYV